MSEPSVVLCTLCLNEMEWLPRLYQQHKDWPGLKAWIFVEGADVEYQKANPSKVTDTGLSTDATTGWLANLQKQSNQIIHVPAGLSECENKAQGKCQLRTHYLKLADDFRPDFLYVLDADEFYTKEDQRRIMECMQGIRSRYTAFCFRQRHIWRPKSIREKPLLELEAVGGFWDIPHTRGYRWEPGLQYRKNHNTPEYSDGILTDRKLMQFDKMPNTPQCVHLGFASNHQFRKAKNQYYAGRGEAQDPKRQWYVQSRRVFEYWRPGKRMPYGAEIRPYDGPIPECFCE